MQVGFSNSVWNAEDLGKPIPDSEHAVSVCLPLWRHVVGYEEKDPAVRDRLQSGYPRFVLNRYVRQLFERVESELAREGERCLVLPSERVAARCASFVRGQGHEARLFSLQRLGLCAVLFPEAAWDDAWAYWQHTGELVSSRQAAAFLRGAEPDRGAEQAKRAVRQRLSELFEVPLEDVFLFPSGMAAIYAALRAFRRLRSSGRTVQLGLPYVDILKLQERLGTPGCRPEQAVHFLPTGSEDELGRLEELARSEPLVGLFCEAPGNPLLRTPNLPRLSELAASSGFPLLVDDTLAALVNLNVLPWADVVATSLTKFFSGVGDVLGGSLVLNPHRPLYGSLKSALLAEYEDLLFGDDAVVLERNSRDFRQRVAQINVNAERLADFLTHHPAVQCVYYPKFQTRENYDRLRRPGGGFGGLLSFTVQREEQNAPRVYDSLRVAKGPNLGTNYTLCCPYTLLAHYQELDFARRCGASPFLLRVSVGLEPADELVQRFDEALQQAEL